jgi:SPP1 family predicted phage head-tail adaptor
MLSIVKSSQNFAWAFLPDVAKHLHTEQTTDSLGGVVNTDTIVTTFRCRIAPIRGKLAIDASRTAPTSTAVLYTPIHVSLQLGQRLIVSDKLFTVTESDSPSGFSVLLRHFLEEVK